MDARYLAFVNRSTAFVPGQQAAKRFEPETAVPIGCSVSRSRYLPLAAGGKPDIVSQRVSRENCDGHQSASREGREV